MIFYTSGIGDKPTGLLARQAASQVLVDITDYRHVQNLYADNKIALDSGAYAYFKADITPNRKYAEFYRDAYQDVDLAFKLALDCIGDATLTMELWQQCFVGRGFTPIYQWGAPPTELDIYLRDAPNGLVAIGGLAKIMRGGKGEKNKIEKKRLDTVRDRMLNELRDLCEIYPGRFHILGLNSLKGIDMLRSLAYSADSSKWLDGGRYGQVIFQNTRTNKLTAAPAKAIAEYADMDRSQRMVFNAINIEMYANGKN